MPDLDEGTLMYMPTTLPGLSVTKAAELLQTQDRIIKSFPEVGIVFGKAGRAHDRDRSGADRDVRDHHQPEAEERMAAGRHARQPQGRDGPGAPVPRRLQRLDDADPGPHRHALDRASARRSASRCSAPTSPRWRRSPAQIEAVLKAVPGTSSAYAERVIGGYYLDIVPDRMALGRYGLTVGDVQDVISTALGGEVVTTTVEGRERYGVTIRYPRDLRSDPAGDRDATCRCRCRGGGTVPLGEVAKIKLTRGATSIRTENGQLAVYVFVDIAGRDLGGYVAEAQAERSRTR